MTQPKQNIDTRLTLVVGVDGSGKSTFLAGMEQKYDCDIIEPSSTPGMKKFKKDNTGTLITNDFIRSRESLFLSHNIDFAERYASSEAAHIVTTGNSLVTLVSHGIMRAIVGGETKEYALEISLGKWIKLKEPLPDEVVLVHAPDEVIQERIKARQFNGQSEEAFWGFNSPHFLSHYQAAWISAVRQVPQVLDIPTLALDTSTLAPNEMIDKYSLTLRG